MPTRAVVEDGEWVPAEHRKGVGDVLTARGGLAEESDVRGGSRTDDPPGGL
jgi:hypothetical protein